MDTSPAPRYDSVTRLLHALLALGVSFQLILSAVMTVPAGRGMGVRDWHRAAFEWHARLGLSVAAILALHWAWSLLPVSRPGVRALFPWLSFAGRVQLRRQAADLCRGRLPAARPVSALAATVHGLGLLAVTGSAAGGSINYLGYFLGMPIRASVLHGVARWHIAMGYSVLAFLAAHAFVATLHRLAKGRVAPSATLMLMLCCVTTAAYGQQRRPIEDDFFTTPDHIRIHFLRAGKQGPRPSLVLIPGFTLSATLWSEQLSRFSNDRLVIAVDPRSQAGSSQTLTSNSPEGRAKDLHDLLEHFGIGPFVIVGWSQGAQDIAAYVTQYGTDALAGVVFVDSPVSAGPEEITLHPGFSKAILSRLEDYARNPSEYCTGMVHSIFAKPHPELNLDALITESEKTPAAVGTQMLIMDIFGRDRRTAYQKIDKPTLVITSAGSPLLQAQKEMAAAIPSAHFEAVEGAGHAVFIDDPQRFDKALEDLLREADRSPHPRR